MAAALVAERQVDDVSQRFAGNVTPQVVDEYLGPAGGLSGAGRRAVG